MKPLTEASNLPLSPLVALLATGTMSPGHQESVIITCWQRCSVTKFNVQQSMRVYFALEPSACLNMQPSVTVALDVWQFQ